MTKSDQLSRSIKPLHGIAGDVLSTIYKAAIEWRNFKYDHFNFCSSKVSRPVISIGGIRAGGTGKTPMALMVGKILFEKGYKTAFLSRGYGRTIRQNCVVSPEEQADWRKTGDEPAMLHESVKGCWLGIDPNRIASAKRLETLVSAKTVFVLDDGFQHRKIKRDLDIVCLDCSALDDKIIPAGYLREPIGSLKRAQAAMIIGSEPEIPVMAELKITLMNKFPGLETFTLVQKPSSWVNLQTGERCENVPLKSPVALCGIARPERFLAMLSEFNIHPSKTLIFPDHYVYNSEQLKRIQELYSHGVVTTHKDAVRLKEPNVEICPNFWYLNMELAFTDKDLLNRFNRIIDTVLNKF
jgi:tetraacyldisaccharide 4'-kinase